MVLQYIHLRVLRFDTEYETMHLDQKLISNMKQTVVLYPHIVFSHLNPTVELAKLFDDDDFDTTIVIPNLPSHHQSASAISSLISRVSVSHPSISFHHLPPPPLVSFPSSDSNIFHLFRLNNHHLQDFLTQLAKTSSVHAVIIDFLCSPALDVTAQLGLPSYFFFCSGASSLCACLNLPKLISETTSPLKDLGEGQLTLPGLPPVAPSDVPSPLLDPNDEVHQEYLSMFTSLAKADGIIVNTYRSLEVRAVSTLDKGQFPPVYCIGPLLGTEFYSEGEETHECLTWLDAQPKASVVFLCFGSMSSFAIEQLKEIAIGLEKSGQRFLWVVRYPTTEDPAKPLEALLPGGFLERTAGRGMVVKSWAPQTAVLGHESVGGFVSHCGWNSVLEAVSAGVPMIAWPRALYTEQGLNKVFLVEAKLAVEMKGYNKELVSAEEVEIKVRWLIESEEGRELKEQAAAAKERAMAARSCGGSSEATWAELVSDLKHHHQHGGSGRAHSDIPICD